MDVKSAFLYGKIEEEVIVNGDLVSLVASASAGAEGHIPPKTAKQKLAKKNELKAKSTLMLAIPNEHLLKFHACKDANSLWEVIKNRFRGKKESKKMQKTILKQNYENFAASNQEGLDKTYDRVKRFIKKTGRKLDLNGKETVGFDKTKVKCYNCHRRGYFARKCRAPRNQGNKNRDAPTRNALVDTSTTNALVVQDGISGYNWSFQAEEELTNFVLMAYTSQGLSNSLSLDYEDGISGYDWSFQAEEELTNFVLMAYTSQDKTGLGYDGQMNESDLNDIHVNESEVLNNVVDSRESNGNDNQVNDRFKKSEGYHAILPPYTGNYIPPRADLSFVRLDNSIFKSKVSETITSVPKIKTNASKTSKDSLEKPKTIRSSAPLIEECESNSENENVFKPKKVKKTVKPSLENIEFVNARNTTVANENKAKKPRKFSQSPRVNTAKQSSHRAVALVSAVRRVNTIASRPNVNNTLPTTYSYFKAYSPVRRPFKQKSAAKINNFNEKVRTAKVNNATTARPKAAGSVVEGNWNNAIKSSACWIWIPKGKLIDHILKDSGSYTLKIFNYVNP
nr:ribonuclease H-like domain-containing protein [Tanacetum cinerariifolium]